MYIKVLGVDRVTWLIGCVKWCSGFSLCSKRRGSKLYRKVLWVFLFFPSLVFCVPYFSPPPFHTSTIHVAQLLHKWLVLKWTPRGWLGTCVTWTVRGLDGQIQRSRVFSHLKSLSTDIGFLQETHLRITDQIRLSKPWIGQVFHSNCNSINLEALLS